LEGDPERGYYEVVPAAVAALAAATTYLAGNRLVGAQRARATALSSFIAPAYRRSARCAAETLLGTEIVLLDHDHGSREAIGEARDPQR
jgi:hypothetical protein